MLKQKAIRSFEVNRIKRGPLALSDVAEVIELTMNTTAEEILKDVERTKNVEWVKEKWCIK